VRSFNTATGVTLTIGVRFLTLEGEELAWSFTHTPLTNGSLATSLCPLAEGWLLSAIVFASAGAPTGTQCLAVLRIVRGQTSNAQALGVLCQGAITASQEISWPSTIPSSGGGLTSLIGLARIITGTNPAAGSEISETVTAGKTWRLHAFRATLVTSATAGNRLPDLTVDDGATIVFNSDAQLNEPASSTFTFQWGPVGQRDGAAGTYSWAMTPVGLLIPAGGRLRTSTSGLQVGDDWGAPVYAVEEF